MVNSKHLLKEFLLIFLGSIIYALSTVLFIFPHSLLLGGTSGISVVLSRVLTFSPGIILTIINLTLVVLAFLILGKDMAVKTLVGSILTTVFIGVLEKPLSLEVPLVSNICLSTIVGATLIAIASGIMFYVDSSSGGTDIIALIVKKFSNIKIGKALLITDVLIVLVGGVLSGLTIFLSSFLGLLIKTLGIDLVISIISKGLKKKGSEVK